MAQQIALQVDFARSALATRAQRWPLLAWPTWTRYSDWRVKAISIEYTEWVWKCMESSHCSDMTSINQPITQKSKSHYSVFWGKVKLDFTTSTEFKGDKICLKSHLTWWKEIEEKVIKRTLEDWWFSGEYLAQHKMTISRNCCGGNCCCTYHVFPKRSGSFFKVNIEIKHDQVESSRYWTFDCWLVFTSMTCRRSSWRMAALSLGAQDHPWDMIRYDSNMVRWFEGYESWWMWHDIVDAMPKILIDMMRSCCLRKSFAKHGTFDDSKSPCKTHMTIPVVNRYFAWGRASELPGCSKLWQDLGVFISLIALAKRSSQ